MYDVFLSMSLDRSISIVLCPAILGPESVFFTILRDPIGQFISGWDYNHGKHFGFDTIDELVQHLGAPEIECVIRNGRSLPGIP